MSLIHKIAFINRNLWFPACLADRIQSVAHVTHDSGRKIIAEAWDAAGLYQVGSFIGDRFAEWNGHYRDDVRQFVKKRSQYS